MLHSRRFDLMFLLLVVLMAPAYGQGGEDRGFCCTGWLHRTKGTVGGEFHHTEALFFSGIPLIDDLEVWSFNHDEYALWDVEVGTKVGGWQVGNDARFDLYDYVVLWPSTGEWFNLPWVTFTADMLGGEFKSHQAPYIPITSGAPFVWLNSGTTMLWDAGHKTQAGLACHWWWQEDLPKETHWGVELQRQIGDVTVKGRYCPFGSGGDTVWLDLTGPISF